MRAYVFERTATMITWANLILIWCHINYYPVKAAGWNHLIIQDTTLWNSEQSQLWKNEMIQKAECRARLQLFDGPSVGTAL